MGRNTGRLIQVNIGATRADRCADTSGLAYIHVAYLAAAFLGFLRCHPRGWSNTVTVSPCWKIFSTIFANSGYYQRAISDGSIVVDGANNRPYCAPGDPVSAWAVDGTARTIVPPVGFPKSDSEHIPDSPCLWTYAGGPGPSGKPVTFLRIERRRDRSRRAGARRPGSPVEDGGWHRSTIWKSEAGDLVGSPESRRLTTFVADHRPNRRANQKASHADLVVAALALTGGDRNRVPVTFQQLRFST